jgi:hypothetical protein
MMTKNTGDDNWGQLLSDFGIEDNLRENAVTPEEPQAAKPTESARSDDFGGGLVDSETQVSEESMQPKEKKSIFSRFPKINFFGAPPEVSLDSVMEGVKSPSLGGRAFTDNKLEKMPVSQERTDRREKSRREKDVPREPDAWSTVASQIDVLASGDEPKEITEERPTKRVISSMFDDPIPESEESRALKNLMEKQPNRQEVRGDAFLEEEADFRQRGRGRRKPQPEEREIRGRGSRYRPPVEVDDLPESDFEMVDDETPAPRGRGRRGSRYSEESQNRGYRDREPIQDDVPQEEWSEIDAALQGRGEPSQRGGRRQRYDNQRENQRYDKRRRPERFNESVMDREPLDEEESGVVAVHGNIPSWDEAVNDVLLGNMARHKGHGHAGGGQSGGRSGRGRR